MHRWYVIPRNRWFNIYLHKIMADDDARALHDHPWHSLSLRLKGKLIEWYFAPGHIAAKRRYAPRLVFRRATFAHRLEVADGPVWTLFITGPRIREWGFHCFNGWVPWQQFVDPDDTGQRGRGCGD